MGTLHLYCINPALLIVSKYLPAAISAVYGWSFVISCLRRCIRKACSYAQIAIWIIWRGCRGAMFLQLLMVLLPIDKCDLTLLHKH